MIYPTQNDIGRMVTSNDVVGMLRSFYSTVWPITKTVMTLQDVTGRIYTEDTRNCNWAVFDNSDLNQVNEETTTMNYSTAIFLVSDKARCVAATYEADDKDGNPDIASRAYFKTFDHSLKVGDLVVVPTGTRHGFTVNKICEVDVEPDLESHKAMAWIAGRFDPSDHKKTLADEQEAIDMLKAAEKTHRQNEIRKKMLEHVDQTALSALKIASGVTALPPKTE